MVDILPRAKQQPAGLIACRSEEHTKNAVMAAVGDNIRTLHSQLTARGVDCTLEWNSGGHFKDADLRTAKAFRWVMEEHT